MIPGSPIPHPASGSRDRGNRPHSAEEAVCDNETGSLKGLCNAYCEAMDCHLDEGVHASQTACDRVLANYRKKADGADPPCLDPGCAQTATEAANAFYFDCLADMTHCKSCARGARSVFGKTYSRCVKRCRIDCNAIYKACVNTCSDKPCVIECGNDFTECTTTCDDLEEKYFPPDTCE